jgi:UDP-N-acetylmuramate-alanine ligase
MATLAAMLKRKGHDVQGSDQDMYPPMSDFLASEGIRTLVGYAPEHIDGDLDPASWKKHSIARSAIARCPRPSASTFSGAPARS